MKANKRKHLSGKERFCIEKMLKCGKSFGEIARTLARGLSTISEEVNASGGRNNYNARKADHRAYLKQYWKKRECNKVAMNGDLSRHVEKSLGRGLSPEAISARIKEEKRYEYTSGKSIRKFVDRRPSLERFLFWNRNNQKSGPKRKKGEYLHDPDRKFIEMRPIEALYEYGHWEGDFIVSKHNSWVLLVLVEKYSKIIRLALLPNRNNDLVNETIVSLLKGFSIKTLILDNDIAFIKWKLLEKMLGSEIFFCHPYHSWEKGLVENINRWLRQFIPKGSDLSRLSIENIEWIEDWFNHLPRVCLEGRTAYEIIIEKESGRLVRSLEINLPDLRIWG
jgi:transposase, IS30 family